MRDDMNNLALIVGIIILVFIIYKYKYNNNKLLYNIMTDLPIITRYYL